MPAYVKGGSLLGGGETGSGPLRIIGEPPHR